MGKKNKHKFTSVQMLGNGILALTFEDGSKYYYPANVYLSGFDLVRISRDRSTVTLPSGEELDSDAIYALL